MTTDEVKRLVWGVGEKLTPLVKITGSKTGNISYIEKNKPKKFVAYVLGSLLLKYDVTKEEMEKFILEIQEKRNERV